MQKVTFACVCPYFHRHHMSCFFFLLSLGENYCSQSFQSLSSQRQLSFYVQWTIVKIWKLWKSKCSNPTLGTFKGISKNCTTIKVTRTAILPHQGLPNIQFFLVLSIIWILCIYLGKPQKQQVKLLCASPLELTFRAFLHTSSLTVGFPSLATKIITALVTNYPIIMSYLVGLLKKSYKHPSIHF